MNKIITSVFALFLFSQSSVFAAGPITGEEVLAGIEFTPEDLVITVIRSCPGESQYSIDVDGDLLTVNRIDGRDCRPLPGPRKLYFSREELGIGEHETFTLKNKIISTRSRR
jgi:hypothetical protein